MVGRPDPTRPEAGFTLPVFDRLAPPPPPELVAARIESNAAPGDIVADLHGRGGWIARAAIDRQRRAFSLETGPLARLLAEVVLRPPDLRHLDAAFSSLAAAPRGETSLKLAISDLFSTRCATCGRQLVADEFTWTAETSPGRLVRKQYRCAICRDQQGGLELRQAEPDDADIARSVADVAGSAARRRLRERFAVPDGADGLAEAALGLHSDRQLVGLAAILERIDGDLRAAPVESALRLAFLHAVLPASRLSAGPGRWPAVRISGGSIRTPLPDPWRERNPWLAFEDGFRLVRAFVQRLGAAALGPLEARLGSDLRSLIDGSATAVVRVQTPGALAVLADEGRAAARDVDRAGRPRIRLVLGQPPGRLSQERLSATWLGTCWALGREAAALLPLDALAGPAIRTPWSWQAAALRRSLEAVAPHMARDGRAILLIEGAAPEAVVAAVVGGVAAGYRLVGVRLAEDGEPDANGIVELVPPGGILPPSARTRAGMTLEPGPGGAGDPGLVPGRGIFAPPERIDARPFSAAEAGRSIVETAVAVLRARGEPASTERLLGEILVGLDRTGQLARLVATAPPDERGHGSRGAHDTPSDPGARPRLDASARSGGDQDDAGGIGTRVARDDGPAPDPVERILALVRDELGRPDQRRLVELEPGRWWLGERRDVEAAEVPLSDRVEWVVYSLLSTAGPIGEPAFADRVASLFRGHDLPDEALIRACLASYRSAASTPDRLQTGDDVRRRTTEHTDLLARLALAGHRLGMRVWLGVREQGRRYGTGTLGDLLDERERSVWLPSIVRAPAEDLEAVDCIWYVRGRSAILFEVEWTAMLGDLLLKRHVRIPPHPGLVRILAVPPERGPLVAHRLAASPLLRTAMDAGDWSLVLWPQLRAWLERKPLRLDDLEPYLGLEPAAAGRGEQLGLFQPPDAVG